MQGEPLQKIRVWDLPTRLVHWVLAACVVGLLVTGWNGGRWMEWHARLGYAVATLLLFRLLWGFVGGRWSRFAAFPPSPMGLWRYLRAGPAADAAGHSPLGALSVYAMLVLLGAQVGTGLFSDDREEFAGPLNGWVSNAMARSLTWYHKAVGEPALLVLVVLHLAAIAYYALVRRRDLVMPMLGGDQTLPASVPASRDDARSRLLALALLAACAAAVTALVKLGGRAA